MRHDAQLAMWSCAMQCQQLQGICAELCCYEEHGTWQA